MKGKRKICLLLSCILLFTFIILPKQAEANQMAGYENIAQTSKLALYYHKEKGSILLQNKSNGFIWSSSVLEETYDISKLNKTWQGNLNSLFSFTYTNIRTGGGAIITSSLVNGKPKIETKSIENGIHINYSFEEIDISFSVEIRIDEDTLTVTIPKDTIIENSDMVLVSVDMMPFFGAAVDKQDGYLFYPDGSGAILDFNDMAHFGEKKKSWNIYGSDIVNYLDKNEPAMLPTFGAKLGNNGFLAVVDEGEQDSVISLTPSNNILGLNTISCEFIYRRQFEDPRVKQRVVKRYDTEIIATDHSIKYFILDGEDANYSGMANRYRKYLLDNNKMVKSITEKDKIPLGIDLFMGINERGLLFDKFITMTTFENAQEILEIFMDQGVEDIQTQLKGWTRRGYNSEPLQFPPNRKLGGNGGLKKLTEFTKKQNVKLFLYSNLLDAIGKNGGFSKRNDVVYLGNGMIFTDYKKEYFVLSPRYIVNEFYKKILPWANKYPISGLSFGGLGHRLYYDYNVKNYTTKEETKNFWSEIMKSSIDHFENAMTEGGNAYVLDSVNRLSTIPYTDTGYYFTTESIPFYQMVIHGMIPYSGKPGNLSHDLQKEKLKWVEYGYMPHFELTYETSDRLKHTEYNTLFTSYYKDWIQVATDIYEEFNQRLGSIWSETMVYHEKVQEDVYKVRYSNNTIVYINYNESDTIVGNHTIKGLDYLVVEEGGGYR